MTYFSQYEQDKFLNTVVFNNKTGGVFIDIGAHDGITFSNSFFFENEKKYSGFCVEPNPIVFERLNANRVSNKLNACIGTSVGKAKFLAVSGYGEMLSGLLDFYTSEHLERVDLIIKENGGEKKIIEVDVVTFDFLSEKINGEVDFCSIDTEGNELSILTTLNFNNISIKCFTIENNYNDTRIVKLLEDNGYIKIYNLGCDQVFVKNELFNYSMKMRMYKFKVLGKLKRLLKK
ncbi:MAG: FkbM family methyltransferase [Chitinophagaceae bacterium]|nr:FkbM family methyltransferase [Chitinophagaceae bacterium]